ncbi:MAG TPA: hypothetical protein VF618_01995 [Thermoanaerobaculia bacterium]
MHDLAESGKGSPVVTNASADEAIQAADGGIEPEEGASEAVELALTIVEPESEPEPVALVLRDGGVAVVDPSHAPPFYLTDAQKLAWGFIKAIDELSTAIEGFKLPHPKTAKHVRGARTVSREFLNTMIFAARHAPRLGDVKTMDPDRAQAILEFNQAFRPVAQRVATFLKGLNFTIEAGKAQVVSEALTTYHVARGLARKHVELESYVHYMRRDLGRKGNKAPRKKKGT